MEGVSKSDLDNFLESKGFILKQWQHSREFFGSFFEIWQSNVFKIQFVQDRSIRSMDISSLSDDDNWFDLELIKCLIENNNKLNKHMSESDFITFFKVHFKEILTLFSPKNYSRTQKSLELIRDARARQMFPDLYK